LIAYVAITSRFLDRPVNLCVVAESASGKNRAVNAAREFHPAEAVHAFSAASPMALIYSEECFQHTVVFYEEADSIPDEGPGGSIIRSLAENNRITYEVTETVEDPATGRQRRVARRIEKEGPTGLITTSTKSLPHQLSTRMLEISLRDDAEQTRAVMLAHARSVNSQDGRARVDLGPFLELQKLIANGGVRRAVVPFAQALAELVPIGAVRMRRDFKQLLTFVQAVALLYQFQRERTPDDEAIIATLDDYAETRKLLAPIFDAVTAEGLTPAIRETVEAIDENETGISEVELRQRLPQSNGDPLSKGTVSWRVKRAIHGGWLVNAEWRAGRPARLKRGDPLPNAETALPTVEDVRRRFDQERPV
jgi:hypothetical protein